MREYCEQFANQDRQGNEQADQQSLQDQLEGRASGADQSIEDVGANANEQQVVPYQEDGGFEVSRDQRVTSVVGEPRELPSRDGADDGGDGKCALLYQLWEARDFWKDQVPGVFRRHKRSEPRRPGLKLHPEA